MNIGKLIIEFLWGGKRLRITNTILKKKNKVGELALLDLEARGNLVVLD